MVEKQSGLPSFDAVFEPGQMGVQVFDSRYLRRRCGNGRPDEWHAGHSEA